MRYLACFAFSTYPSSHSPFYVFLFMATIFVPSPHALNSMSNRRAPLANVPNAANSPHRLTKRPRPANLQWDICPQPPLKKQLVDRADVENRSPVKKPNPANADSKLFTRRNCGNPTAFEKKLVAARERPAHTTTSKNAKGGYKVCPESIDVIKQWQKHYRKVFPQYVFYFESIPVELRNKCSRQIAALGAVSCACSTLFSSHSFTICLTCPIRERRNSSPKS